MWGLQAAWFGLSFEVMVCYCLIWLGGQQSASKQTLTQCGACVLKISLLAKLTADPVV
jgi:hypothetical protein